MLPGLEVAAAGWLLLAAGGIQCDVPQAPVIKVTPVTRPIEYDFSKSQAELGQFQIDTISPYAPGTDTTTGGLRHDQPRTAIQVRIGYREYSNGLVCLWYDSIDFEIELQPKIYIAREYPAGKCRDAVLEHEKDHVRVDREVINKYVQEIGASLQKAVNAAGAVGPYKAGDREEKKELLINHVRTAVDAHTLLLEAEMRKRQAEVDSLEEYTRISEICRREGR